ncbi:COG1361 S-layer family protein [uncultured Anaerococcus sp.]|uniref:COG1361 S-layer family protein n=1 Tax=uncultured Anaerococcus sp. TaxID=293428 RepID=UPI0025EAE52C|nr:S-layer protein [uncultured Anaerococcus sp.]
MNDTQNTSIDMPINIKNQPKIMISSYNLSPKIAEAGKSFDLSFSLYNTNNKNTIYNLKATIEQNLGAQPQNTGENNAMVSDGSVFSPVNQSNSFYVAALYPWNTANKHITMNVLPNAVAGNYVIDLSIEYEDGDGNQYKTTEAIGIPVVQRAGVTMGEVKSDELIVGSPTEMSVNIYNTGKDNLNTFMCDVIGKGIKIDNDRKFIGNFNTGTQETFSFTATPTREGEIEGQIMLSYEDSTGKVHTQIKDFKNEVVEGMPEGMEGEMGGDLGEEMGMEDPSMGQGSVLKSPFVWIGLITIIILAAILYKKRKNKKEDEELLIDDED